MEQRVRRWLENGRALGLEVHTLRLAQQTAARRGLPEAGALARQLQAQAAELEEVSCRMLEGISAMEDSRLRALLTARYLTDQSWRQVAAEMGYSEMQVSRLHRQALRELAEKLDTSRQTAAFGNAPPCTQVF